MTRTLRSTLLSSVACLSLATLALAGDLRTTLLRSGLLAESLAASGVSSGSVAGTIDALEASDTYAEGALDLADQAFATAQTEVQALEQLVKDGGATAKDLLALEGARSERVAAESAQTQALSDLFQAGIAGLPEAARATLTTIRGNASEEVPIEFKTIYREEDEWHRLKRLLSHERVAAKLGEEPDSDCAAELATLRSASPVASARAALEANLATVTAAWNAASGG